METKNLILIEVFCTHHNIEISFIDSLHEFGLIEIVIIEEAKYIPHEQLSEVEKLIRLYYELNINLEGLDVISNLQRKINDLQKELIATKKQTEII